MHVRRLLTTYGVQLPALGVVCCFLAAGCGTDSGLLEAYGYAVVLDPAEVTVSAGGKPAQVTATFTTLDDEARFDGWSFPSDDGYTLAGDTKSNPTTITIQASARQPVSMSMRTSGEAVTHTPYVTAKVSGEEDKAGARLLINVIAPFLKLTVIRSNRANINPQTSEVSASILVEAVNDTQQADFQFGVGFVNGQYDIRLDPSGGSYDVTAFVPAVTGIPAGPAKTATFEIRYTARANSPQTVGRVQINLQAVATPAGGEKIASALTALHF